MTSAGGQEWKGLAAFSEAKTHETRCVRRRVGAIRVAGGGRQEDRPPDACIGLVRNRLVVEVEDAVWQRQLWTLRGQILQRMEQVLGRKIVEEIEFRIAVPRMKPVAGGSLDRLRRMRLT